MTKRLLVILSIVLLVTSAYAAPRQKALVEIFTATWCGYCPASARAAEEMRANGDPAAIIEYHDRDAYETESSRFRNAYYRNPWEGGIPVGFVDGVEMISGTLPGQNSNYTRYMAKITPRMSLTSPCTIDLMGIAMDGVFTGTVTVTKDAGVTMDPAKLKIAFTESHIQQSWQGMSTLEYVERGMVPSAQGIALDFTSSDVFSYTFEFPLSSSWVTDNMEIAAFVQNDATREVLQADSKAFNDLEYFPKPASIDVVSSLAEETITISWTAPEEQNRGLIGYAVFKDNEMIAETDNNTFTYVDTDVEEGYSYVYSVKGKYDDIPNGMSGATEKVRKGIGADNAPTNLVGEIEQINHARLSWTPSIDTTNNTGYVIYVDDVLVGTTDQTEFVFDQLDNGEHEFMVKALVDGNETDPSNDIDLDVELLPATGLRATIPSSNNRIILQWYAPDYEMSTRTFTKYKVIRNNEVIVERTGLNYFDNDVEPDARYEYKIVAVYNDMFDGPESETLIVENMVVSASDVNQKVIEITNYPNPFNPSTNFNYTLPESSKVTIEIFNILGQKVKTVVDEYQALGQKTAKWNGITENGSPAASGIYFYKIKAGKYSASKKMVLLK